LLPNDTNWKSSTAQGIVFSSLKSGDYNLEIQSGSSAGSWNQESLFIGIEVIPIFYKTIWFYALLLVLLSLIYLAFYRFRISEVKKQNLLEIEVNNARNKALSVQLNPHFIFNSMNSINSYLANNDNKSAMRYLGKFAKMMRNMFENSQNTYISVHEELIAIERYIEVEKIRLEDKFDYAIHLADGIDAHETFMPSLILQPFVENCIWHGIAPLKNPGQIQIIIKKGSEANQLVIEIRDNGAGLNPRDHQDRLDAKRIRSTQVIKERFSILERLTKVKHRIEINPNPEGEGVVVRLVFNSRKELNIA